MTAISQEDPAYAPGHSEAEYQRLIEQGRMYAGATRALFAEAGLSAGMRVLDIGCGVGDVSILAASVVGPDGRVVGVDGDARSIVVARRRAEALALPGVSFVESDVRDLSFEEPFDALVGRFVLMYLADPSDALRRLLAHLRPGGIVALQELQIDFEGGQRASWPEVPLVEEALGWLRETFDQLGIETRMGFKLVQAFRDVGLPDPRLHMYSPLASSADDPGYQWCARTLQSVMPFLEGLGIATAESVDAGTLPARLRDAVARRDAVVAWAPAVGAWAVKPSIDRS